jgi:hypothetical protein
LDKSGCEIIFWYFVDSNSPAIVRLDYEKYELSGQTETAMNKCPTGVIVHRGKSAPQPKPSSKSVEN